MFKNVKKLAEKRTHLRLGVEKLMAKFAEATEDVKGFHAHIITVQEINGYEYEYCIRSGHTDLYWDSSQGFSNSSDRWNDWSEDYSFYNGMSVSMLRKVCEALPKAFQDIQKQINKECSEIDSFMNKFNN